MCLCLCPCLFLWCHIDFKAQKLPYPPPVLPQPLRTAYSSCRWSTVSVSLQLPSIFWLGESRNSESLKLGPRLLVSLAGAVEPEGERRGKNRDRGYSTDKFSLRDKVTTLDTHVPREQQISRSYKYLTFSSGRALGDSVRWLSCCLSNDIN